MRGPVHSLFRQLRQAVAEPFTVALRLKAVDIAEAGRLVRRSGRILLRLPGPSDPPGTVAAFVMPVPGQRWIASGTPCRLGAVLEVSSLNLTPAGDDAIVTSGLLRRVSLTAITAAAQAQFGLIA